MWLTDSSAFQDHLDEKQYTNDIINAYTYYLKHKYNQPNMMTATNKKFTKPHTFHHLSAVDSQDILILNVPPKPNTIIYVQLYSLQTQYLSNQRAPPLV
ncbi:hypothetical protein H704_00800 [Bartonella bacilliformis Peru38]|nr:hypothetical protein BbINS_04160 [Bartonella bacilliformis INS]EYS89738.1 hypothetical protein X472_00173 [Bartonella bacilliformis San Pedro600-02]EYS95362.1 hypothetical protein X470_00893 [Bartonella bacilliformis Peru-18]KEG17126.1 hypothetical protein H709_00786 [Bartonella bacilliformis CUSCO5]KEG20554.1 hypothetical protein H704_00800 [Bartonella bacilliformis Peru38]KEG22936.1 hypothetical protein H703_00786 [Bartonella bacilliformis Ver075]